MWAISRTKIGFGMPLTIPALLLLAYALGKRQDAAFNRLLKFYSYGTIRRYYTNDWATYEHHLDASSHQISDL